MSSVRPWSIQTPLPSAQRVGAFASIFADEAGTDMPDRRGGGAQHAPAWLADVIAYERARRSVRLPARERRCCVVAEAPGGGVGQG